MENEILKDILVELKGLRSEAVTTNKRIDQTNGRIDETNNQLGKAIVQIGETNKRIETTISRLDGLHQSFVVLQQGVADVRYELQNIKEILSEKVIWQNDSIAIATREGKVIYGVINKEPKK